MSSMGYGQWSLVTWSAIVIVYEKVFLFYFVSFFRNISKTAQTTFTKNIERSHGISVYKKKALKTEHSNFGCNWLTN